MIYVPEIPQNSLKDRIQKIVYLARSAFESGVYEEELLTFEFNPPASEEKLAMLEKELNTVLDEDYKNFLRFSDGAILCFNSAEFYDTDSVIALDKQEKDDGLPEELIIIADVIGDGEVLCYSRKTHKFVSFFEGEEDEYDSFLDFLDEVIDDIKDSLADSFDFDIDDQ